MREAAIPDVPISIVSMTHSSVIRSILVEQLSLPALL
jgi:hypothetical protein